MTASRIGRRALVASGLAALPALARPPRARAAASSLGIGVLNDESGPYADLAGPGSVLAARTAKAQSSTARASTARTLAADRIRPDELRNLPPEPAAPVAVCEQPTGHEALGTS